MARQTEVRPVIKLRSKLWGLEMVRSDDSRRKQPGDKGVTVGILDTGLDASHPRSGTKLQRPALPQLRARPDRRRRAV